MPTLNVLGGPLTVSIVIAMKRTKQKPKELKGMMPQYPARGIMPNTA